jgi:glycopeptide antibiotics resistance protein
MLSIESAQIAFGYGYDWTDVLDMLYDSLGITIAGLVYCQLRRIYTAAHEDWWKVG